MRLMITEELIKKGEDWDDLVVRIPAPKVENKNPIKTKELAEKNSAADSIILGFA